MVGPRAKLVLVVGNSVMHSVLPHGPISLKVFLLVISLMFIVSSSIVKFQVFHLLDF